MKKKIYTPILLVFINLSILFICSCSVGSCILDACYTNYLKKEPPTVESIRKDVKIWAIELPEDFTINYYAYDLGPKGECWWFVELYYDGNDEDFNSTLSTEKDDYFEIRIINVIKASFNEYISNVPEDYELPTFEKNYLWLLKQEDSIRHTTSGETEIFILSQLLILYIPEENKLFIAHSDH